MKRLHRRDLYCWSTFNERLDIDFNSFAWIHERGNVVVDPLPLSEHDRKHLRDLGGAAWIVLTNSSHVRAAKELAAEFGGRIAGPAAEREGFPIPCDRWLKEGDDIHPGLRVMELEGSKTPGELALMLEDTTLIAGDLLRSHRAGELMLLRPEQGLKDPARATASLQRLLAYARLDALLLGDGWCVFRDGRRLLEEFIQSLTSPVAASGTA
ncbi:MBL fold metallo-hydrolase [Hyalangium rubrum]|uniref:MBL fold metallo-hydrolase n=1 Tax=Hyalangium rubrum TaxID=3103134 RepID=A0ABU5HBI7_9BACT|nr:MBL fold metallo-hydrolase [Hyalangium sp. s54d21]MDY7230840.1 MBL fold metallo-hydrolase [Hyalangium sp. s54d21]